VELDLLEEENLLLQQLREFLKKTLPTLQRLSEEERLKLDALEELADFGLLTMRIPEEQGGLGMRVPLLCRVLAEIAQIDPSIALLLAFQQAWSIESLRHLDDKTTQDRLFHAMASGAWVACVLHHPMDEEAASPAPTAENPAKPRTHTVTAKRTEDGSWVLRGEAPFVTLGASAPSLLIEACDQEGGLRYFWLDNEAREKISAQIVEHKLGLRGCETAHLRFNDLLLPPVSCLPIDPLRFSSWRGLRIALAAIHVGITQAALHTARDYALQRKQFGQPIASFQAIQWKIADMAMQADAAMLLVEQAADAWEKGHAKEADHLGHMARLFAAEAAQYATQEAIQIHGGYGFTKEFPVERYYRDAHALRARFGGIPPQQQAIALHWWSEETN
jgi:alkylation response protein AidB-like acyl-CoA dehydrogenase